MLRMQLQGRKVYKSLAHLFFPFAHNRFRSRSLRIGTIEIGVAVTKKLEGGGDDSGV